MINGFSPCATQCPLRLEKREEEFFLKQDWSAGLKIMKK